MKYFVKSNGPDEPVYEKVSGMYSAVEYWWSVGNNK